MGREGQHEWRGDRDERIQTLHVIVHLHKDSLCYHGPNFSFL